MWHKERQGFCESLFPELLGSFCMSYASGYFFQYIFFIWRSDILDLQDPAHWGWITVLNSSCNENFWIGLNSRGRKKKRERIKWHNFNCYMCARGPKFSVVLQQEEFCLRTNFSLTLIPQQWWNFQANGCKRLPRISPFCFFLDGELRALFLLAEPLKIALSHNTFLSFLECTLLSHFRGAL